MLTEIIQAEKKLASYKPLRFDNLLEKLIEFKKTL